MRSLFAFPNPVNELSARLVAGGVVAVTLVILLFGQYWLLIPLAYGFVARVLTGPTLSPLGQVVTRGVKAVFDDVSRGRYFVADVAGRVVASLLITYEWSDWRDGNVWWIQSVYVDSLHRGGGVYRGMYEQVKAIAERENARGIRLYVDRRNTRAQEVYRRCGMNGEHYLVFEWMGTED